MDLDGADQRCCICSVWWFGGSGSGGIFCARAVAAKNFGQCGFCIGGFFVWELVKIALTVAMLMAAPKLILQLNWLALLAGFVVTMKVYWLAVWLRLVRRSSVRKF